MAKVQALETLVDQTQSPSVLLLLDKVRIRVVGQRFKGIQGIRDLCPLFTRKTTHIVPGNPLDEAAKKPLVARDLRKKIVLEKIRKETIAKIPRIHTQIPLFRLQAQSLGNGCSVTI